MKKAIALVCLIISINAAAADSHYCEMLGAVARSVAEDRDNGISYKAELGKLIGASDGLASSKALLELAKSTVKNVYVDMPKLTPVGAYKLYYVGCMASK